jgi:hypothetical protein
MASDDPSEINLDHLHGSIDVLLVTAGAWTQIKRFATITLGSAQCSLIELQIKEFTRLPSSSFILYPIRSPAFAPGRECGRMYMCSRICPPVAGW